MIRGGIRERGTVVEHLRAQDAASTFHNARVIFGDNRISHVIVFNLLYVSSFYKVLLGIMRTLISTFMATRSITLKRIL